MRPLSSPLACAGSRPVVGLGARPSRRLGRLRCRAAVPQRGAGVAQRLACLVLGVAQAVLPAQAAGLAAGGGTMVQLFEWRWTDVAKECEWLGPAGYEAVQVSPPMEHIQGDAWWTRYQPVSHNLTSRSGSEAELLEMLRRCSAAGVRVYADAVINHMAAPPASGRGQGTAGSSYSSRDFPEFAQADFHHDPADLGHNCAIESYRDRWQVQNCDLVALPDLATSQPGVQPRLAAYLARLAEVGFAGARIDAAKHIPAADIAAILQAAAPLLPPDFFVYQEVISGFQEPIQPEEYLGNGKVLEFGYPWELFSHFTRAGELQYLKDVGEGWGLLPSEAAVTFVDNHDLQRSAQDSTLTHRWARLYRLATVFMLAHPYGSPRVMSSYWFDGPDQGPPAVPVHDSDAGGTAVLRCGEGQAWVCEHRWPEIAAMARFRQRTAGLPLQRAQVALQGDLLAFSRGKIGFVAINRGAAFEGSLDTGLPPGRYRDLLQPAGQAVQVGLAGWAKLRIGEQSAVALLAAEPAEEPVEPFER